MKAWHRSELLTSLVFDETHHAFLYGLVLFTLVLGLLIDLRLCNRPDRKTLNDSLRRGLRAYHAATEWVETFLSAVELVVHLDVAQNVEQVHVSATGPTTWAVGLTQRLHH